MLSLKQDHSKNNKFGFDLLIKKLPFCFLVSYHVVPITRSLIRLVTKAKRLIINHFLRKLHSQSILLDYTVLFSLIVWRLWHYLTFRKFLRKLNLRWLLCFKTFGRCLWWYGIYLFIICFVIDSEKRDCIVIR